MRKLFRLLTPALVYFCVATILAQMVLVGVLWWKGRFNEEAALKVLAIVHGVPWGASATPESIAAARSLTPEEIARVRFRAALDLDLRESALDKALADLRSMQQQLDDARADHLKAKESFASELEKLQQQTADAALQELRLTLEAMSPQQAKEQILKILDDAPTSADDDPMTDVVSIFKAMPPDKRKKILSEFKTPEESEKLAEILRDIRLGGDEMQLIKNASRQAEPTTSR